MYSVPSNYLRIPTEDTYVAIRLTKSISIYGLIPSVLRAILIYAFLQGIVTTVPLQVQ